MNRTIVFISPVDGEIVDHGFMEEQQSYSSKKYLILLWKSSLEKIVLINLQQGYFITIYLAPTDYHRIHCPLRG